MNKATVKLVLDGKPMSNGKHQVYLRVIKERKRKMISLGISCEKEHFRNEQFTKHHPDYHLENELLLRVKSKAMETIRTLQLTKNDFTLQEFEETFRGHREKADINVANFFDEIVMELQRSGKYGTAQAYGDTKASILKFAGNDLVFKDITPTFLEKYEVFLRERGSSNGGVAFKMRELRALYNKARKRNRIPDLPYPFKGYKISKLKQESRKIALSIDEFKKIRQVDLSLHPHLTEAHRYFLFSVFTRGMNFHDMMFLKWSNVQNGRIYYTRSKTKSRLNLAIIPPVEKILKYFRDQKRTTEFVFPILLKEGMTPRQIAYRKHKVLRRYNKRLKEIASLAGVDKSLTTYVARHSFATILKSKGSPIEKISEMMGHSDVSITIAYLKEFSNEELDKENERLIDL